MGLGSGHCGPGRRVTGYHREGGTARRYDRLSILAYLMLGWVGVIAIGPVSAALSSVSLWLLAAGGLTYVAGALFYPLERLQPSGMVSWPWPQACISRPPPWHWPEHPGFPQAWIGKQTRPDGKRTADQHLPHAPAWPALPLSEWTCLRLPIPEVSSRIPRSGPDARVWASGCRHRHHREPDRPAEADRTPAWASRWPCPVQPRYSPRSLP